MAKQRAITLTSDQKEELEQIRTRHPKPYMRERAAAILKVEAGQSAHQVALKGLLQRRDPDTLYEWLDRFEAEGAAGLKVRPGRGRKPAFATRHTDEASARLELLHLVRREPRLFGYPRSRWTLEMIKASCPWLELETQAGLWQLLKRLEISYKRGRDYLYSPDPYYEAKLSLIERCRLRAYYAPQDYAFLYLDEVSYYRQPSLARAYEASGHSQPLARRSYRTNTAFRVVGALDALTGRVLYRQRSKINLTGLSAFYADIRAAYPTQKEIYVVEDNWPIHFHPDVLARLQPQHLPWPPRLPPHWSTEPSPKAVQDDLPIQILCLPTYASWLNPIEKLWRWLKPDVLHLHRLSDAWAVLKHRVARFLDQFQDGSDELLHYVGLLPI